MQLKTSVLAALALAFSISSNTYAQMRLSDFSVYLGGNTSGESGTLQDFAQLAPQSILLNKSFSGYNSYSDYSSWNTSGRISFMLGFDFNEKENNEKSLNPQLRIGLTYTNGISLSNDQWKDEYHPYDTLTSSQTGNQTFIDSVYSDQYYMSYNSDNIVLDVSLLLRTNPETRWAFYSGAGIMAGVSINSSTHIEHYESSYIENSSGHPYYGGSYTDHNYTSESETIRNKNSFLVSGYIPMGVDFRLGNKGELWKRTHLFYELRTTININSIPEIGTFTRGSVHHGIGIKIS